MRLELPFPPINNTYYRNVKGRALISKKGREYKKLVTDQMAHYGLAGKRIKHELIVLVDLHVPDERRRDVDNYGKGLFDALTECKFWLDDSQVKQKTVTMKEVDKENPRAVITVVLKDQFF